MKKLNLILLVVFLSTHLLSQEYFNKRFGFGIEAVPDDGKNIIEVEDGYVVSGGSGGLNHIEKFRFGISKFNFNGELIYSKSWGDDESIWYSESSGSLIKNFGNYYSLNFKESDSLREGKIVQYNTQFDTITTITYKRSPYPYDSTYIGRDLTATTNGFAIVGSLNVLQEAKQKNNFHFSEKSKFNENNYGYQVTDQYATYQVFVLSIDSLGNKMWEVRIPYDTLVNHLINKSSINSNKLNYLVYTQGYSIVQTKDKGFAIGLRSTPNNFFYNEHSNPFVVKLDSLGNINWALNLGGEFQDNTTFICNSIDSSIGSTCRYDIDSVSWDQYLSKTRIVKVNYSGEIIWDKFIGDPQIYIGPLNIRNNINNGFIISGYSGQNNYPIEPRRMGYGINVNQYGDSIWLRKFSKLGDKESRNLFYDMIPTSNNGYLGIGTCFPGGNDTGNQDAWIIKVDSLGCTDFNECWVGTKENTNISSNDVLIKIFPNPANGYVNIKIEGISNSTRKLNCKITDLLGRTIYDNEFPNAQNELRINISDWIKGIYLLTVKNRFKEIVCDKLIIN